MRAGWPMRAAGWPVMRLNRDRTPPSAAAVAATGRPVSFAQVQAVINQRCTLCHNAQAQQKGNALHTPALIQQHAQAIYLQAVVQKLMPMNNATQISDDERALIKRWFEAGAKPD